jgi:hypothetical protein
MNLFLTDGPSNNSKPMPPAAMSTFATPPTRDSIKTREISATARAKVRACSRCLELNNNSSRDQKNWPFRQLCVYFLLS